MPVAVDMVVPAVSVDDLAVAREAGRELFGAALRVRDGLGACLTGEAARWGVGR